jgi:hypothetical protein
MSRLVWALIVAIAATAEPASAATFKASTLHFQDFTGAVEISTNETDEIDVTIRQGKTHHPVTAALADGVVTIKGEKWLEEATKDCCNERIRRTFDPRLGREARTGQPLDQGFFADYPTVVISMPRKGAVSFVDARMTLDMGPLEGPLALDACYVYGQTGPVDEAVIGVLSGSRLVVGDVGAGLEVDVSGDADVMVGDAASADIDIAGTGDVVLAAVGGMLDISIAGSGSVRAERLVGPLTARIAGSGSVAVREGRADPLTAIIDGSGAVFFEGVAERPDLRLFGSAEVRIGEVRGRMERAGGGEVYVGGKLIERN